MAEGSARGLPTPDDERTMDIVRRVEAGETLQQAAKPWGITPERARQLANRWFAFNGTSLKELRQRQRDARQADQLVERVQTARLCVVCLGPVLNNAGGGTSRRRTCSTECSQELNRRPWRYDDRRRRGLRLANARSLLRNPEGKPEAELARARRIVADPSIPFTSRYRHLGPDTVDRAVNATRALLAKGPRRRRDVVDELERQGIKATDEVLRRVRTGLGVTISRRGFGPGAHHEWALSPERTSGR